MTTKNLTSDFSTSSTTQVNVSGMSFGVSTGGLYTIECFGALQTAAVTNGFALLVSLPTSATTVIGQTQSFINTLGLTAHQQRASNATPGVITALATANVNLPVKSDFLIKAGSNGTVNLTLRSETGSKITLVGGLFTATLLRVN